MRPLYYLLYYFIFTIVVAISSSIENGLFTKDFYEIDVRNDSSTMFCSTDLEIFSLPSKNDENFNFKYTVLSSSKNNNNFGNRSSEEEFAANNDPFSIDAHTGKLRLNLKHRSLKTANYFVVKMTAASAVDDRRWETMIGIGIDQSLASQCSTGSVITKKHADVRNMSKLKLLFADSFDSYDFHRLFRADDVDDEQLDQEIYLSEDLHVDSFICYVLVQSSFDIKLVGPNSDTFK
jgi:hypothetical protein